MAEENKIIWPEGSAEVESVQDFEWLMAGKTGQPLRKIHKDKYKNYLSITGIEMKPVATGSLPLGPSGQERKMIIQSAGVWTYGGNNFVNPVGEIMTLWWNGTTWSVADRAVLPSVRMVEKSQNGNLRHMHLVRVHQKLASCF
ncbi:hypothetical protein OKW96_08890 [Sphingobacterium sp. KU25419]|nr:hypothetical protein OKW96_08890 [Sphingobacterium sp. KU25419]